MAFLYYVQDSHNNRRRVATLFYILESKVLYKVATRRRLLYLCYYQVWSISDHPTPKTRSDKIAIFISNCCALRNDVDIMVNESQIPS